MNIKSRVERGVGIGSSEADLAFWLRSGGSASLDPPYVTDANRP